MQYKKPYKRRRRKGVTVKAEDILGKVLARYGIEHDLKRYSFVTNWDDIVGNEVAKRCRPDSIRGNTLYIAVNDSIWAQELSFMSNDILVRVNHFLKKNNSFGAGSSPIKGVKFFVDPKY